MYLFKVNLHFNSLIDLDSNIKICLHASILEVDSRSFGVDLALGL